MCRKANPRLVVKRARFSALTHADIYRAIGPALGLPDQKAAAAVQVRQEIDLRLGAAFTRFQTLLLQDRFDWGEFAQEGRKNPVISYGPCQFPTLGFIVRRFWEAAAHTAEPHWTIEMAHNPGGGLRADFTWSRGRLFDKRVAATLYELCAVQPTVTVLSCNGRTTTRHAPCPLNTLEMQKRACSKLRVSPEQVMKLAEELYQNGFISYPRTETDSFPPEMDLREVVGACDAAVAPV